MSKIVVLCMLIFLVSCENTPRIPDLKTNFSDTIKQLPVKAVEEVIDPCKVKWHMLTVSDTGSYIWLPCDAEHRQITFSKNAGKTYISYLLGQSSILYEVIESKNTDSYTYKFVCVKENESVEETTRFNLKIENGIGHWTIYPGNEELQFIPESRFGNYKMYKQPCKECWGDDDSFCDTKKKKIN